MLVGELLVEKWKAALYSFVCAKTIFVNGMTLSTEFNKSHICVWQKRECGEITSFSADVTYSFLRTYGHHFRSLSTTALIRSTAECISNYFKIFLKVVYWF